MSVLAELWNEGIDFDRCPIREDREYQERQRIQSERAERFMATLTKEQRRTVLEIEREENELRFLEEQSKFVEAFKLGARLMLEITTDT